MTGRRSRLPVRLRECAIDDIEVAVVRIGAASHERELATVQTNIVYCFVDAAAAVAWALGERGIRAIGRSGKVRFVAHAQVDEESVEAALDAMAAILH